MLQSAEVGFLRTHALSKFQPWLFAAGVAYDDYAISPKRFHWQGQNSAGPSTPVGRRYINQGDGPDSPWTFQLFVQETKDHAFRACGPVTSLDYRGEKPISITWRLHYPLPPRLYEAFSVLRETHRHLSGLC